MSLLSRLAVQAARAYGILSSDKNKVAASYLVVAGGGGSGGGGGGAGGYQTSTFSLSTLNTYSIAVGAGGAGVVCVGGGTSGIAGSNSSISGTGLSTVTSVGGGYGGGGVNGGSGGSGGGSGSSGSLVGGGSGTSGQGNNGGGNGGFTSSPFPAGGGGGAGAVGGTATSTTQAGNGGVGLASSISGSSVYYAGGGGGGYYATGGTATTGGTGGGGAGNSNTGNAVSGTANTGGGGGGTGPSYLGGSGGSGIVIISYTSATPKFVGGTLTTSGGNQIHTFTSSGTLSPLTPVTASYLVVAGGGGGGRQYGGQGSAGGGGAGGYLTSSTTLYSGATYVVTVGAGGAGGSSAGAAPSGSDSSLSGTGLTTVTSTGGGGGAGSSSSGASGGSGGGGQGETAPKTGGSGTSGQGNAGGAGVNAGGGGGGASAAGTSAVLQVAGVGGAGTSSSISGSSVTYAGGGGGGGYGTQSGGTGGAGGGGTGQTGSSTTLASSGTTNLGGGGGGAAYVATGNYNGASGGSGTVIISYAGSQVFNGGLVTSSGGNTIHTFNATGALTPLTNNLNNSLRFRASASASLSRTPTIAGNQQKWTWSGWVKRGTLGGTYNQIFGTITGATDATYLALTFGGNSVADNLTFQGANTVYRQSTQVFRDPSAWYHIVCSIDTTQATAANRIKLYVNGNEITTFTTNNNPSQNANLIINSVVAHQIFKENYSSIYTDGYLTDVNFVDGQQLEPYYFGNNDANGVWKPILYKGTYGTNGFYLTFGNTTSTTTLGYDSSGNGNNWTTNNISLTAGTTYDAMTDVPTNTSATVANYPTLNPLVRPYSANTDIISAGNLKASSTSGPSGSQGATMAFTSGKYYFEATATTVSGANVTWIGVCNNLTYYSLGTWTSAFVRDYGYTYASNGKSYTNATPSGTTYGATYTSGDIIGVAIDADAGTMTFYKNGTSQGTAFTGMSYTGGYVFGCTEDNSNVVDFNFGQRPFSYTPPSGYVALNTYNLPTPTILQGNKYMDATPFTGTSGAQTIVNQGQFKPDLVWVKSRSNAQDHYLMDSVRGGTKLLRTSTTGADSTSTSPAFITSFNSNGFSSDSASLLTNAYTYVGWQWQAGQGSSASNTDGTVTSTVSVNTTAGFSIVKYVNPASGSFTIGHGLGVAPKMIITKSTDTVSPWPTWFTGFTNGEYVNLNTTAAKASQTNYWGTAVPTSTVFGNTVGTTWNSGVNVIAYCFAEIAGFSKFGSYTGNASTDGPFVYLGFRPKFIMIKSSSGVQSWHIIDTARSTYNLAGEGLEPNTSAAEYTPASSGFPMDILSNGFKIRYATEPNLSGGTYTYMAYAENPFKNSNAR